MKTKDSTIKTVLYIAIAFILLLGVGDLPYGFYQLLRFVAFAGFGYLAYLQYKDKATDRMILFIILALLFQPFFPISLGKIIWKIVDVIVAGYLIYLLIMAFSKTKHKR